MKKKGLAPYYQKGKRCKIKVQACTKGVSLPDTIVDKLVNLERIGMYVTKKGLRNQW